jgi:hypothetical protein
VDCTFEDGSEVGAGWCGDCDFVVMEKEDCDSRVDTLEVPGVPLELGPNEASLLLSSFEGS